jgi:proteic killer suppression protein
VRILFESTKFESVCVDKRKARKEYGTQGGDLLIRRIQELRAAPCLHDMRNMPGRCHELKGNLAGMLAIDLKHPRRLLFKPEPPTPQKEDGGLDWSHVEGVVICRVEDYHD